MLGGETWNVRVSLGNWTGWVKVPKALVPDAHDANQCVIDAGSEFVKEIVEDKKWEERFDALYPDWKESEKR